MCGIVGVLTTEPGSHLNPLNDFFRQALFADTFRGKDSTGVALLHTGEGGLPEVYKKAMTAPDYLQLGRSLDLLSSLQGWNVMLGHNRAATKGGVSHHTSHPFQISTITMVHNGTISNHYSLTGGKDFIVDSEAIANAISVDGIEKVVKQIIGAFVLVYHDAKDGSVNIIRNDERPLWIGICSKTDSVVFASERGMLEWLASRNQIKLSKVFQPEVGEHYKYYVGGHKSWKSSPLVRSLQLYKPVYVPPVKRAVPLMDLMEQPTEDLLLKPLSWTRSYDDKGVERGIVKAVIIGCTAPHEAQMSGVSKDQWEDMRGGSIVADVVSATKVNILTRVFLNNQGYTVFKDAPTVEKDPQLLIGYNSEGITEKAFNLATKGGCAYCTGDLDPNDAGSIHWLDRNTPVCDMCSDSVGIYAY